MAKRSIRNSGIRVNTDDPGLVHAFRSRLAAFLGWSHEGARDLYASFGYPRTLSAELLYAMYKRNDIAQRIVKAFPTSTWRDVPLVRDEAGDSSDEKLADGSKNEKFSPFVKAVEDFFSSTKLLHYIERADRLSGIGRYGVLVLGFNDGKTLDKPLIPTGTEKLLWMSPYAEINCRINQWEQNVLSPRFGLPVTYTMNSSELSDGQKSPAVSMNVHYSRVLHISEFNDQSDTFGTPRLECVFNRLMDLEKVVGGSAEVFWLCANRGLLLSADKESVLGDEDITAMRTQADELSHQQRRTIVGQGLTAQVLGSEDPDPEPNARILMQLIAGATGMPMRILIGSESGELASSQDENTWSGKIGERRKMFAAPMVLRPLLQLLIDTGNLPQPDGQFWTEWPDTDGLSAATAADVNFKRTQSLTAYANSPNAPLVVPLPEFRSKILGLPPNSEYEDEAFEQPVEVGPDGKPVDENADGGDVEGQKGDIIEPNTNKSKPRSLYVSRRVLNRKAITDWAKAQGFKDVEVDLHVTVAASRAAIDWTTVHPAYSPEDSGRLMIQPGGARIVEPIGTQGATALLFVSADLMWRHNEFERAGCSWDFGDYQPHITISYKAGPDLSKVEPYTGAIALGPEIFEEFKDNARAA